METTTREAIMPGMEDTGPENQALASDLMPQLHCCIAHLPKAERKLNEALYFDGMTKTEYASKVNLLQPSVCWRHQNILMKLRI